MGSGSCKRIARSHESVLDAENGSVEVRYRCKEACRTKYLLDIEDNFTELLHGQVDIASGSDVMCVLEGGEGETYEKGNVISWPYFRESYEWKRSSMRGSGSCAMLWVVNNDENETAHSFYGNLHVP